ncbi:MAG: hypothetical protein WC234_05150 [Endomicrobiaceae bacterium]|jgi:hypothetical protein|nr:hypothetical protein [Endomicrobiaceae bacterium]
MSYGFCKDCRFYDGQRCIPKDSIKAANGGCATFAGDENRDDKLCKTCRFYDGEYCNTKKSRMQFNANCGTWSPF